MKKAMVTAIATVGIFFISLIQMCLAMPESTISVEPSNPKVSPGDTFTVNITVNPDSVGMGGAQYDLYFNNNSLNATSQTPGIFLTQDGASTMGVTNTINNTLGKTEYGEIRTGVNYGVTNPGVLATITFKAMEPGTSSLSLSNNVILSDPLGYQIPGVSVNNGTCEIEAVEQTPTPTPTPTPTATPTSGDEDDGNGGASTTPMLTQTPTPIPAQTPGLTPIQTPTINPVLSPSLPLSPTITRSPTPTASMPQPISEKNNRLPGFEAAFAVMGLLAISYLILKRRRGDKK